MSEKIADMPYESLERDILYEEIAPPEVLVKERLHAARELARRRSLAAANARQARTSSRLRLGKSASIWSSVSFSRPDGETLLGIWICAIVATCTALLLRCTHRSESHPRRIGHDVAGERG
jgi:hypothetical protein